MPSLVQTIQPESVSYSSTTGKLEALEKAVPGCRATCRTPNYDAVEDPDEPLALDVEFQNYRKRNSGDKYTPRMGRVSIVNTRGLVVYDTYVHYPYDSTNELQLPPVRMRETFKVDWPDLAIRNGARPASEVHYHLRELFRGRTIVGHGMGNDYRAVGKVWEKGQQPFDLQKKVYGQIKLEDAIADFLPFEEFEYHNPVHDARATMLLYLMHFPYQDRNSFSDPPPKFDDADEFPAPGQEGTKKTGKR